VTKIVYILSDFCDAMKTAFVPTTQGVALGCYATPFGAKGSGKK
jgi:hypothetical protein